MSKYAPIDMEALALDSLQRLGSVAQQAYAPPVRVITCWMCRGQKFNEDGSRCYNCAGLGRVATDGGEV